MYSRAVSKSANVARAVASRGFATGKDVKFGAEVRRQRAAARHR